MNVYMIHTFDKTGWIVSYTYSCKSPFGALFTTNYFSQCVNDVTIRKSCVTHL